MNLKEMRDMVNSIVNYSPDTEIYDEECDRLLNSVYFDLFTDQPWNFAQKEIRITAHADVEATDGTVNNGSTAISTATNFFQSWMEGAVVATPDGNEYTIAYVGSATSANITEDYTGSTVAGTATFTVKERYIDLPKNCDSILQVGRRPLDSSNTPSPGNYIPLSRAEGEWWNLPLDDTGDADAWLPYDDRTVLPPVEAPDLAAGAGSLDAGTYEVCYTYVVEGKESGPSPVATITVGASASISVDMERTTETAAVKKVYVKAPGFDAFYLHPDGTSVIPTNNVQILSAAIPDTWYAYDRLPEHGGNYQRIALYPRQDSDTVITIRYIYKPQKLINDTDQPELPASHHKFLVYQALVDIFMKHDQTSYAGVYESKATKELRKMEAQYLVKEARRWIKSGYGMEKLYDVSWHGPLIHS